MTAPLTILELIEIFFARLTLKRWCLQRNLTLKNILIFSTPLPRIQRWGCRCAQEFSVNKVKPYRGEYPSSLGQSHASAYRMSLAVSSSMISYICLRGHLGSVSRIKPHWMFQNHKKVIKGHDKLTSCSSLMHSTCFC